MKNAESSQEIKKLSYRFLGLVSIIVLVLLFVSGQSQSAFSMDSFPRQDIMDGENDWLLRQVPSGEFLEITTDSGKSHLRYETNAAECRKAAYNDSIRNHFHPPDIKSVGYFSNGSILNATLWLSAAYKDAAENASAWLSPDVRNSPWYSVSYLLSVVVHGSYDVKGADYAVRYDWDALNNSWTKRIEEIAPSGEIRYLLIEPDYDIFQNNSNKNYLDMTLELSKLNYPGQYSILFSVYDHFIYNRRVCAMADITPRTQVPPPMFNLTTLPGSIEIRPGEEKNVKLQVKSNSNIQAKVHFLLDNVTLGEKIESDLSADEISIPPYGLVTSNVRIKPLENISVDAYTLPILASLEIPTIATTRRSAETIANLQNQSLDQSSYFTITVLPPLTFDQKLDLFTKQWILPLTGIWTLFAGIVAVVVPLIIHIYKKNKK